MNIFNYIDNYGIYNLDQDKERYSYIDQQFKMMGAENNERK